MSSRYLLIGEFIFIGGFLFIAYLLFQKHPPTPDAVAVDVKLAVARGQVYVVPEGNDFVYLVKQPDGSTQRLAANQFTQRLYESGKVTGLSAYLGPTSPAVLAWLGVGLMGQILFTGRMVIQWIASEKEKRSVVPPLFWWMSLIGSLMLLAYFLWRKDPIGLLGQLFGSFIYLRNLLLIYGTHHPEQVPAPKDTVAAA